MDTTPSQQSEKDTRRATYIRAYPGSRKALKRLVFLLTEAEDLKFLGQPATQEALVMASWLWMERLATADLKGVAETLKPYLVALERDAAGKDADAPDAATDPSPRPPSGTRIIGVRRLPDELPAEGPKPKGEGPKRKKPPAR